jgi:hypothetical protein
VDDDSSDSCYVTKNKDDIKNMFPSEDSDLVVDDDSSEEEDGLSPGSGSEPRHKKRKPGERGGGKPRRWVSLTK